MRKYVAIAGIAAFGALPVVGAAAAGGAGGVTGPAFYVDGALYRTVGTPTDLSGSGAPDHSFDTIYDIAAQAHNVATAAPGDAGYNGGRWQVQVVSIDDYDAALQAADANGSGDLDSADEVQAAFDAGVAELSGAGPSFVCPVIPVPHG